MTKFIFQHPSAFTVCFAVTVLALLTVFILVKLSHFMSSLQRMAEKKTNDDVLRPSRHKKENHNEQ